MSAPRRELDPAERRAAADREREERQRRLELTAGGSDFMGRVAAIGRGEKPRRRDKKKGSDRGDS